MNHMRPEDLKSFIERLDIMKRWALSECDARAETPPASHPAVVDAAWPTLRDIEGALDRIARGVYALCTTCHRVIARERMLMDPAAVSCADCESRQTG